MTQYAIPAHSATGRITFDLSLTTGRTASDPHHGDIQLHPCGNSDQCQTSDSVTCTLLVYYGRESEEATWGTVCKDGFVDLDGLGSTAICNILGYEQGEYWQESRDQFLELDFV